MTIQTKQALSLKHGENSKKRTLTKSEVVTRVADLCDVDKNTTEKVIDALFTAITTALAQGEQVRFIGFGLFTTVERKALTARNPQTGETFIAAPSVRTTFRPGKLLKDHIKDTHRG